MGFTVRFKDRDDSARFDNPADMFSIEGGALVIDREDGTTSIYSSSVWETIEVDRSHDPSFIRPTRLTGISASPTGPVTYPER